MLVRQVVKMKITIVLSSLYDVKIYPFLVIRSITIDRLCIGLESFGVVPLAL